MRTIVVTGGAGFIGSHIAAAFAAASGFNVVICDRFHNGDKWRNLSKHPIDAVVSPADIFYWLEMHGEDVEMIVHMGAVSSTTETDVDLILENNFSLSTMLWRWCAENQKRFIYASSAAAYGDGKMGFSDDFSTEYLRRLKPLNPYGWSKLLFDKYVAGQVAAGKPTPSQWAGLRFFNVYGPNEYHKGDQKSVVAKLFPHAKAGASVKLFKSAHPDYPDGGQMRDFVYVHDCVRVVQWLYQTPGVSGLFNLGTGKARTFADLAHALYAGLNMPPRIAFVDMPGELVNKYQYFTEANMQKLQAAGYPHPFTSLEDGVRDYVQNYLMQDDQYA